MQTLTLQSSFESFGMRNDWLKDVQPELAAFTKREVVKIRERQIAQLNERIEMLVKKLAAFGDKDLEPAKRLSAELQHDRKSLADARAANAQNDEAYAKALAKTQKLIREAYLRTFSRLPTESELAKVTQYAVELNIASGALNDLLWALVNSKEFIVNH